MKRTTIAATAARLGVSTRTVYRRMDRDGKSASELRQTRTTCETSPCRTFDGYRVCHDGRIQSCWALGRESRKTGQWRDLTISRHGRGLVVWIGEKRVSVRTVYRDALGEAEAERLWQIAKRKVT